MKNFWQGLIAFICAALIGVSTAAGDPMALIQDTSGQILIELKQNKASLKSNPQIVYRIINRLLLPHVDTLGMSKAVLGRQVWQSATDQQKAQFTTEFTRLLVHTYASALASYEDQEIKFLPMRNNVDAKTRLQIDSIIVQHKGPQIPVSYRLALINEDWKIYDLNVDGVSLLQSYHSQFSAEISQHGFPSLLQKLQRQNDTFTTKA